MKFSKAEPESRQSQCSIPLILTSIDLWRFAFGKADCCMPCVQLVRHANLDQSLERAGWRHPVEKARCGFAATFQPPRRKSASSPNLTDAALCVNGSPLRRSGRCKVAKRNVPSEPAYSCHSSLSRRMENLVKAKQTLHHSTSHR